MSLTQKLTFLLVVIALLLPSGAALAANKPEYILSIRNRTGGDIVLDLVNKDKHNNAVYINGLTQTLVKENIYTFYMSTPCGNAAGTLNINFRKTLFVSCRGGSPYIQLDKQFIAGRMTRFTGE